MKFILCCKKKFILFLISLFAVLNVNAQSDQKMIVTVAKQFSTDFVNGNYGGMH
jgi:hypothetical protein